MSRHPLLVTLLVLALLGVAGVGADAGPLDARVGETRIAYKDTGTSLREKPSGLAAVTATLPENTHVRVLEIRQPWLRVQAPQGSGWLYAAQTVEPGALAPNPRPVRTQGAAGAGVNQRDASAAGRQLDAMVEKRYRASRRDLEAAYRRVDALEAATQAMKPGDSVAFIVGGALGRQGQDYQRPRLLPPQPAPRSQPRRTQPQQPSGGVGGLLGRLGGEAVRRLGGGSAGEELARGLIETASGTIQQLKTKFTPENEYYLGRAVAASAIAQFGVDPSEARRRYVRLVGDAVVRLSTRLPANFGGYHFEVLDSDAINGVSGPGGFVLLTRGAVSACRSEDELAAVLAHELAHVKLGHGEQTLRKGRGFQTFMSGLVRTGANTADIDGERWGQALTDFFAKVVGEVSRTSMEHDYGRGAEFQADVEGTYILYDVFYDHVALRNYLAMLAARPGGAFAKAATHAPPTYRVANLDPIVARYGPFGGSPRVKQARIDRLARGRQ